MLVNMEQVIGLGGKKYLLFSTLFFILQRQIHHQWRHRNRIRENVLGSPLVLKSAKMVSNPASVLLSVFLLNSLKGKSLSLSGAVTRSYRSELSEVRANFRKRSL